jgi:hypothetical protein
VVLFGVAREMKDTKPPIPTVVVRAEILSDSDRDGVVRLDLASAVPRRGMWSVADLESGANLAFSTPGYDPPRIDFADLLPRNNPGQDNKVEWAFGEIDLMVARPGRDGGAWRFYASKDSLFDENRNNGRRLKLDLSHLTPIGDSPAVPAKFRNGDIVAVFDREGMQYGIMEVGK